MLYVELTSAFHLSKTAYMAGTKKRKMDISKAVVEAIYSLDPPGRFLKQCPDTGQWNELSKRDAADKAAQAMSYAIKGESLKEKRKHRRSRRSLPVPQGGAVATKSLQSTDRPPQLHLYSHSSSNTQLEGNVSSSSVAHHGLFAHGPAAAADTNNTESTVSNDHTDSVADATGNFNRRQQLRPQLQQSNSTTTTLPTSSIDQNVNQNGLIQVLAQAVQQQRNHHQQQQQQLPLQYTLGQNPLGQQMMMPQQQLSPALLEGLTQQMLAQAQQQQVIQQQQQQQQLLLLQRLLNQQNVLPPASLPPPSTPFLSSQGVLSMNAILPAGGTSSTNYSTGSQSQLAANNQILQNLQQQQQLNPLNNALLLSSVLSSLQHQPISNAGTSNVPHESQQLDLLQRSLMMQQQQQQQSLPLDPLHQAWLSQIQNSQNPPPITAQPSATVAAMLTRQEDSEEEEEEEHSVSEENPI